MTDQAEGFCTDPFAILVGLCQAGEIPAMAMLVPERNRFELWRRMHARHEPENKHKPFAWLRALSNPTFPTKESLWQRGLEEWEGEIAKYEREYMKTFDADLKLAILSEVAPKALAPQIAMNSASLSMCKTLREFIVQYLNSKKPPFWLKPFWLKKGSRQNCWGKRGCSWALQCSWGISRRPWALGAAGGRLVVRAEGFPVPPHATCGGHARRKLLRCGP